MLPTETDRERLGKLLALADSDRDAEALAALRAARDLLSRNGLSLADVWQVASASRDGARQGAAMAESDSLGWALDTAHEEVTRLHGVIADLERRLAEAHGELEATKRSAPAAAPPPEDARARPDDGVDRLLERFRRLEQRIAADGKAGRRQTDIRDAVLAYLEDPETASLSNREIARRVGVSPQTVCNWRRRMADSLGMPPDETLVERNGRTYRMRVGRIGRRG